MFRLAYRNFGDHEALVVNHTVLGGALGAVRWYEIRNPARRRRSSSRAPSSIPTPISGLAASRWIARATSPSGSTRWARTTFPASTSPARKPSDPRGAMFGPLRLAIGSGVQFKSFKRWGDYSSMTVDPKDDCTFWFTQEYYISSGSFNWATHVGAFKFDNCKPGGK